MITNNHKSNEKHRLFDLHQTLISDNAFDVEFVQRNGVRLLTRGKSWE